jgi:tight adherence protein C
MVLAVAAVAAVLAVSCAVAAVALPATTRERMLKTLAQFGTGRITVNQSVDHSFTARVRPPVVWFIQLVGDVITPPMIQKRISRQLAYAGSPESWPIDRVVRGRMVGAVVIGLSGLMLFPEHRLLGLLGGMVGGILLPEVLVRNTAAKRQESMMRSLPDVLDALVIGVEAGLGLDAAMAQVAGMMRGPLPDEIRRALQEMQLGVSRTEALRDLSGRTTVAEIKRLVTALVQAGEMGISVAGILREHAAEQRIKRRQRAEEQAQKVAVKLLFPVLFCLFPVIFVVVIGPAVLNMLRSL